jgi:O-antigen/teichoic acid export membrane protein
LKKVEESLKNKTVKGLGWSALDNATRYGMQFVIGIVLARLLSPDDYGLLGLVGIFTVVCTAFVNGGFTTALIRKKNATDDDYNTVFICNLGMSLLLYAVTFLCAPLIANFFERQELTALVRVSSLGLIIGALGLVQQTRLTKRIDFKTQTKITLVASVVSGIVGIGMALAGFGVWALVWQQLVSQATTTLLLYVYNRWLPRLSFSAESFHDLFGFGWKMMVSILLDAVWKELTQVVVGKFYSPATLGQYTRAKHYAKLLSSNLTSVVERVTYPVLSSIQDDKQRMVSAYRRIIRTSMFITTVALFSLAAVSEPLIYCMIGPKWHEASTYLPLICITFSLYPLHAINLNMLQVQGRSDLFLGLEVIKKIISLAPLFVGAFVGIIPMLWVNIIVGIIAYFLNSYFSGRLLGYSSWMQLRDIAPSYALATSIALSVWFMKYLPLSYWIILPLQIAVGAIVFFSICKLFKMNEYNEIIEILKQQRKR